jgi:ribosome-binding factor A
MANPRTVARVSARIKQRVAHCLQFELNDPRAGVVTITEVRLSADMRNATILWTLPEEKDRSKTLHMLDGATGFVRKQLGRVLETRTIPALRWEFDDSIQKAADMERMIEQAVARDEEIRGEPDPQEDSEE